MIYQDEVAKFIESSQDNRRLFLQEELIVEITERLAAEMAAQCISQKLLAEKLGCTKGYVSQLLNGGKNLTLRSLANLADALDCKPNFALERNQGVVQRKVINFPTSFCNMPQWQVEIEDFDLEVDNFNENIECALEG